MHYYLGVDIGTTSTKSVAFSEAGEVLAAYSTSYKMHHPQQDWCEQDSEEVFEAVISSSNKVMAALPAHRPVFVAFSAAMHGLLVMDRNNAPITNCIIWADNRA
jgi:gluconokinase